MLRTQDTVPVGVDPETRRASTTTIDQSATGQLAKDDSAALPSAVAEAIPTECPACGSTVAFHVMSARTSPRCLCCGCLLWCRKWVVDDIVVLDALRGGDLDSEDISSFFRSTPWPGGVPRVVINLRQVDFVSSAFLAALLTFQRRLVAAKGTLILCGANHVIRGIFVRTRLNSLFEIVDDEDEALRQIRADR